MMNMSDKDQYFPSKLFNLCEIVQEMFILTEKLFLKLFYLQCEFNIKLK